MNRIFAQRTMPKHQSVNPLGFLSRTYLQKLRLKAKRNGIWYMALARIDRVLIDLTIKVTENIRSLSLAKSVLAIVHKLEGSQKSKIQQATDEIGLPIAQRLSQLAQQWGYKTANQWASDLHYARFLAILGINKHLSN